jgi:hypothetical protein
VDAVAKGQVALRGSAGQVAKALGDGATAP